MLNQFSILPDVISTFYFLYCTYTLLPHVLFCSFTFNYCLFFATCARAHLNNKSAIRVGEFPICAYYVDFGTIIYVRNISDIRVRFFWNHPACLLLTNETTVLPECVWVTIILQCFSFNDKCRFRHKHRLRHKCRFNWDRAYFIPQNYASEARIGPVSSPKRVCPLLVFIELVLFNQAR